MPLKINTMEKKPGVFVVSLIGALDTHTHMQLASRLDAIRHSSPGLIVLDLEYLDYISSIGISSILKAGRAVKKHGGRVKLMNLQPQIRKVFEIINALPSQQIFANAREMDQYLDRIQRKVGGAESETELPR
ncbi:anti-sigma factor antagonist [Desulfonema ishimotonii]|uniref:Anti-sigma factor antagonist n=1 Tax=Desulfonema ishimotonii TaxID=45657 RepID=A0A401G4K1_9BACT|nr:STAS domain-containing protein [Desulfonema ishimotonii]GBC64146.1 anti-sigma factor antagonist [Desulfonema ishimotonii]